MNKKLTLRLLTLSILIATISSVANAVPVIRPLIASPFRFTSTPVVSTVDVIVQNPNSFPVQGTLTLYVVQENGVPQTVPYGRIVARPGLNTVKVFVHNAISAANWARVTNLRLVP